MNEFAPGIYYVVGFEGGADKDEVVTFGSAALIRDGKLINAGLTHSRAYPGPASELDEFIRDGVVTPVRPAPIPDHIGDSECYVLRVKTSGIVGAFIHAMTDRRERTSWSDTDGWTYLIYNSYDEMTRFTHIAAEKMIDYVNLFGLEKGDREVMDKAARVLDHRISTYELIVGMSGDSREIEKYLKDLPERNRAPEKLRSKIYKRPE